MEAFPEGYVKFVVKTHLLILIFALFLTISLTMIVSSIYLILISPVLFGFIFFLTSRIIQKHLIIPIRDMDQKGIQVNYSLVPSKLFGVEETSRAYKDQGELLFDGLDIDRTCFKCEETPRFYKMTKGKIIFKSIRIFGIPFKQEIKSDKIRCQECI